jgi:hypothetical protein
MPPARFLPVPRPSLVLLAVIAAGGLVAPFRTAESTTARLEA